MSGSGGGRESAASAESVRVLVVDDALIARSLIGRILEAAEGLELVGTARDGRRALQLLARLTVDVVVLDIEMPVMDGIEALQEIVARHPHVRVVMASTLTRRSAEISLRALELGASDYVPKPDATDALRGDAGFKHEIVEKVRVLGRTARRARLAGVRPGTMHPLDRAVQPGGSPRPALPPDAPPLRRIPDEFRPAAIAIGCSTGGPQALATVLRDLGPPPLPVFVTQHMPPTFTGILAENLSASTGRPCREAEDGAAVSSGTVYIARGGYHMLVACEGGRPHLQLDAGARENYCRPSVDPMLRSLTAAYSGRVLCAILTGMGGDGARAAGTLADAGGVVLAQDEVTSVIWGMPAAVVRDGSCAKVLPVEALGGALRRLAHGEAV